jgi:hypothetical protein
MSETHFTRADWRPSKRRKHTPRVAPYAGQKKAPAAFLAAAVATQFGKGRQPLCRYCRKIALKDLPVCAAHGGAGAKGKQKQWAKSNRGRNMVDLQPAAPDLAAMPVYRTARADDKARLIQAWQTETWLSTLRAILLTV